VAIAEVVKNNPHNKPTAKFRSSVDMALTQDFQLAEAYNTRWLMLRHSLKLYFLAKKSPGIGQGYTVTKLARWLRKPRE
jgi:hypothetical protein